MKMVVNIAIYKYTWEKH